MQDMQQEPIAIIGIGCRFPGANNPQEFWRLLHEGQNAIREVPADRWEIDALYDPDPTQPGKMISRWGGFIDQVDQFDWRALRMNPREVRYMDPQQRLLLEVTWEALEDAGLPRTQIAGSRTSVSIGIGWSDYMRLQARNWSKLDGYTATGNASCFAANRLSHYFNLKGPSIALDAGCTSSLSAVYLACQSLWNGEAQLALAGGVSLMLSPDSTIMVSKAGLLSPEGRCKTLDARADGFVRGEGSGIIVLKPLSHVQKTDRIYALIRGIAMNHNGHNEWIMASNQAAQEELLHEAYRKAAIDPCAIDYVELHGTGFLRGDAIETKALGAVLGASPQRRYPCFIGSVKTNIGHLEAASGIASMIKVALALHHREIPATLNLHTINPDIPLSQLHLAAQRSLSAWPGEEKTPLAGVTTLSFSGANAHAVLSAAAPTEQMACHVEELTQMSQLLLLSARDEQALVALAAAFKDFLVSEQLVDYSSWRNICYTAAVRRDHHDHRIAITARTPQDAIGPLEAFIQRQPLRALSVGEKHEKAQRSCVFLFAHRFPLPSDKDYTILSRNAAFKTCLDECDQLFRRYAALSIWEELSLRDDMLSMTGAPVIFALQVALAALWNSWGVLPDAVVGDGYGEIAAAYVAGALTLDGAVQSIIHAVKASSLREDQEAFRDAYQVKPVAIPTYLMTSGLIHAGQLPHPFQWEKLVSKAHLAASMTDQLFTNNQGVLIELGSASTFAERMIAHSSLHRSTIMLLPSLQLERKTDAGVLEALGALYIQGHELKWATLYEEDQCHCVSLPTYPWQRERLWLDWLDVDAISTPVESLSAKTEQNTTSRVSPQSVQRSLFLHDLKKASQDRQKELMLAHVTRYVRTVLDLDASFALEMDKSLFSIGMDSLTATQLINSLRVSLELALPPTLVFLYSTIESLTGYLMQTIVPSPLQTDVYKKELPENDQQTYLTLQDLQELSATETESLLLEHLAKIERS